LQPAILERGVTADPRTIPPTAASDSASESEDFRENFADSALPTSAPSQTTDSRRIWLLRLRAFLFVTLCATFGVLLLILPWTPKWTDNPLLLNFPGLRDFVSSGFVRGFASGLGLLDLWLGFRQAILYHEEPKNSDQ
jgi:hypothetical protein